MTNLCLSEVINFLPLFSGISGKERDDLLKVAKIKYLSHGQTLFIQGDEMTFFHVVYRGTVQLFRETSDGHEITSDILISGDSLCPSEIADAHPVCHANARAVDNVVLLEIPIYWIKQNLSSLVFKLFSDVSHRLQEATLEVERQATMSAPQLIVCFLYNICARYNFDPKGFELPYSKTLIASRLGMELETFSRSLHKLKEYGITVQGTQVSFHNAQAVENFACDYCSVSGYCFKHTEIENKMASVR